MVSDLYQSLLSHYVWTSLLANQLALEPAVGPEQEGAVPPSPPISGGLFQNNRLYISLLLNRIKYVWKLCNPLGTKKAPLKKIPSLVNKKQKKKKKNHQELLSKVCFRKLDHEWDAECVEPSELIWAKWGRKLAPRCETKRLRRAIKKTSTSQKGAPRTLCYPLLQNQPRGPAGKGLTRCWCQAPDSTTALFTRPTKKTTKTRKAKAARQWFFKNS